MVVLGADDVKRDDRGAAVRPSGVPASAGPAPSCQAHAQSAVPRHPVLVVLGFPAPSGVHPERAPPDRAPPTEAGQTNAPQTNARQTNARQTNARQTNARQTSTGPAPAR